MSEEVLLQMERLLELHNSYESGDYANFSNRISKNNVFRQLKNADACTKYFKNVYRK